jgi:cyclophilin family peptidyl-prolyl cis-trans isomerase
LLPNSNSKKAIAWLSELRDAIAPTPPEVEIAFARVAPQFYMTRADWPLLGAAQNRSKSVQGKSEVSVAQGVRELASIKTGQPTLDSNINEIATNLTRSKLECRPYQPPARPTPIKPGQVTLVGICAPLQPKSVPDFLRAYAALKPKDLVEVLRARLKDNDVVTRGTAADLLGELPPNETNTRALIEALPVALRDKDLNDAVLSILDALAKQKTAASNEAIKTALSSSDQLVRKRAVAHLKENDAGDFSDRIGPAETRNTEADYRRAIARIGKQVRATMLTSKGQFTIEFIPEQAPLTVDNFVQLARRGYFNGVTFHRVVANFVIQGGDPRGDGNGGPGYSIRCEVNEVPYDRAALGMALSGKDTGGSQWFVTHSPQPHLDGGYTVFGRVVSGMDVVDSIVRGDVIRRVIVSERVR